MKVKTSITLSKEALAAIDRLAGSRKNRSAVVERAVRELVTAEARRLRNERDLEILNRHAKRLNAEAADVLTYQVDT
jgi:Arc/MetJ-type ribon-helix-helix transcriptional regulator